MARKLKKCQTQLVKVDYPLSGGRWDLFLWTPELPDSTRIDGWSDSYGSSKQLSYILTTNCRLFVYYKQIETDELYD